MENPAQEAGTVAAEQFTQPSIGSCGLDQISVFEPDSGFAERNGSTVRDDLRPQGLGEIGADVEIMVPFHHDDAGSTLVQQLELLE